MPSRTHNLPAILAFQHDVAVNGTPEQLGVKIIDTTIAFVEGGGENDIDKDSITDSNSKFLIAGFEPGDVITISGSTSNDGEYVAETVVAGTITFRPKGGELVTEAAGDTVTLKATKQVPNGLALVIKAKAGNINNIYVGGNSGQADSNGGGGFTLDANEKATLQVDNTGRIWIDADTNAEGVEVIFESELRI